MSVEDLSRKKPDGNKINIPYSHWHICMLSQSTIVTIQTPPLVTGPSIYFNLDTCIK